jgi:hypothetical protein
MSVSLTCTERQVVTGMSQYNDQNDQMVELHNKLNLLRCFTLNRRSEVYRSLNLNFELVFRIGGFPTRLPNLQTLLNFGNIC